MKRTWECKACDQEFANYKCAISLDDHGCNDALVCPIHCPWFPWNGEKVDWNPVAAPPVVCLCGSTRFRADLAEANRAATMAGKIVLAPGVFGHSGDPMTDEDKARLDRLHFAKIDMADEVLVVNPGGYIGESTRLEIEYATRAGKPVAYTHNTGA